MTNEELKPTEEEQIFPRYPQKTYGLMEMMKGSSTIVGKGGEQDSVLSWPNLVVLEFILILGSTVVLLVWSLVQNAPLTELANPNVTENPAKAPWYFLNLQELLLHMNASLAGVLIPTFLIIGLFILPYVDRNTRDTGTWYASRKGLMMTLFGFGYGVVWIIVLVIIDANFSLKDSLAVPPLPIFDKQFWTQIVPGWIYPASVIGALSVTLMVINRAIWRPNLREAILGGFGAFVGVLIMLTIFSTWFRGKNMNLAPPDEVLVTGLDFLIGPLFGIALAAVTVWWVMRSQKEDPVR